MNSEIQRIAWAKLVLETNKSTSKRIKLNKEEYLEQAKLILEMWGIDWTKDMILNDSHLSCILNPNFKYPTFIGYSIWSIAEFVSKETNVKIKLK